MYTYNTVFSVICLNIVIVKISPDVDELRNAFPHPNYVC